MGYGHPESDVKNNTVEYDNDDNGKINREFSRNYTPAHN